MARNASFRACSVEALGLELAPAEQFERADEPFSYGEDDPEAEAAAAAARGWAEEEGDDGEMPQEELPAPPPRRGR